MANQTYNVNSESSQDVCYPRDLDNIKKNLMIYDDLQLERQNTCEKYYVQGRLSIVDCFYLFGLPRGTISETADFICLVRQNLKNVEHI